MKNRAEIKHIIYALLAAVFYAVNVPASKVFLKTVGPTAMAAFLYLGAGIGVAILSVVTQGKKKAERLSKADMPFVIGMIVLDIVAPIFLMLGIKYGTAANASLLGNFEIVATTVIALFIFKETVTKRLWIAIGLITVSSIILSFEGADSFHFSYGSMLVLIAAICWGLENNCTRKISSKSTYKIVVLKGIFSGTGSLAIALILRETMPGIGIILLVLALGFVAYGLSIFMYVRAQSVLGAAKTSAYYAVAPFVGVILSRILLRESLSRTYYVAMIVMIIGTILVVSDTLCRNHAHWHKHTFTHTHDGCTHTHTVEHTHAHNHYVFDSKHSHHHSVEELESLLEARPQRIRLKS